MYRHKTKTIATLLLIIPLLLTVLFRLTPDMAERYAIYIYPHISSLQTLLTRWFPFSVTDVIYVVLIAIGSILLFRLLFVTGGRWKTARSLLYFLVTLYSLFYLLWGINYSRLDFFARNGLNKTATDTTQFKNYCMEYVEKLNQSFKQRDTLVNPQKLERQIQSSFKQMAHHYVVTLPLVWPNVKPLLFGRLFAGMGVSGYYGVVGGEPLINPYIFHTDYPSAYAHELSHALGVSSEAEANFTAYRVCIHTADPSIHFYGYYSVMHHLLRDASVVISKAFARQMLQTIDPQIMELTAQREAHYQQLYSQKAGEIQSKVYHSFLKSQGVKAGIADYSIVVSYLLTTGE